jgi:hypothetical protein
MNTIRLDFLEIHFDFPNSFENPRNPRNLERFKHENLFFYCLDFEDFIFGVPEFSKEFRRF